MTDRQRNIIINAIKMGGVFVSCGTGDKVNIMNTRWGTIGRMWNRDVFVLPVRKKKYSHELISKNMSFVVNIPTNEMSSQLLRCSNMSGREYDKFKEFGFVPVPAKIVKSVGIAECPCSWSARWSTPPTCMRASSIPPSRGICTWVASITRSSSARSCAAPSTSPKNPLSESPRTLRGALLFYRVSRSRMLSASYRAENGSLEKKFINFRTFYGNVDTLLSTLPFYYNGTNILLYRGGAN